MSEMKPVFKINMSQEDREEARKVSRIQSGNLYLRAGVLNKVMSGVKTNRQYLLYLQSITKDEEISEELRSLIEYAEVEIEALNNLLGQATSSLVQMEERFNPMSISSKKAKTSSKNQTRV